MYCGRDVADWVNQKSEQELNILILRYCPSAITTSPEYIVIRSKTQTSEKFQQKKTQKCQQFTINFDKLSSLKLGVSTILNWDRGNEIHVVQNTKTRKINR